MKSHLKTATCCDIVVCKLEPFIRRLTMERPSIRDPLVWTLIKNFLALSPSYEEDEQNFT
jgi:hypothetical protein